MNEESKWRRKGQQITRNIEYFTDSEKKWTNTAARFIYNFPRTTATHLQKILFSSAQEDDRNVKRSTEQQKEVNIKRYSNSNMRGKY